LSYFKEALEVLLDHEGGYSNNKSDLGGPTKYGISLRFLRSQNALPPDLDFDGDVDGDDVKSLSILQASEIYKVEFWDKLKISSLESQRLSDMVFGLCVNMGPREAIKLLQKSINRLTDNTLEVDGVLGPKTIEEANVLSTAQIIFSYKYSAARFYKDLGGSHKSLSVFTDGWLKRVNSY
jgi:lysozyme family protein